ncbi:MAG: flagellar hook-associated protein FlgK [Lachnospiraceae bacterium]|nr:flagellar hook-associated protein FlgK [Lachnospiraceae bacterium]
MPLMGSFYIGVSGLQTSQNSLNTTAHNVSNADTTGYTRQQILTGTSVYNTLQSDTRAVAKQQIGLGVVYSKTRQVRDTFLDDTYRREVGRQGFYNISSDALTEIEYLLDEMNGESFQESINDLWVSVQELAKDPASAVTQGLFVERCSEFLARANSVYDGISDYQKSLNVTVIDNVDRINKIADSLKTLNDQIRNIECSGIEQANDLRDQRNALLDELAGLANISYSEDLDNTVWVQLEGEDLVRGEIAYKMLTYEDPKTGFVTPFWEKNAKYGYDENHNKIFSQEEAKKAEVFDMSRVISSDLNTDIGSLKSVLLARGDHKANFTDLLEENYTNQVSQSVCMNIQSEFDQLVHNIATTINNIISETAIAAKELNPSSTYLLDESGNPIQIFQKIASDGYGASPVLTANADGTYTYTVDYIAEDQDINETLYTVTNMQINAKLLQQPTKLGFVTADGSVDYTTMEKIKDAFEAEDSTLNPNVKKKSSYIDYYSDLVSQVANSGYVYKSILDSQDKTVGATDSAREQIIGVSQDEELTMMIRFQNAYNASSRYINVVSEMLEHIINTLGM